MPGDVTIIIVTYNSRAYFQRLRTAIERLDPSPSHIILFDNASSEKERPGRADFPESFELVQSERNLGFALANNLAVARTQSRYIALLNPDAFPEPDWLGQLLSAADRFPEAGAFGSTQISALDETRYDGLGDCYHVSGLCWRAGFGRRRGRVPPLEGETFSACAAAALYRRTAWEDAGGFDESFFCFCEDVDLGFRLRLLGWRTIQAAAAVVRHVGGGSAARRSHFAVHYGARNRLRTFVKCMPGPLLLPFLPAHLFGAGIALVAATLRGTGWSAATGVGAALQSLGPLLAARRAVQRRRRAPVAEIARALAWSPLAMVQRAPVIRPPRPAPGGRLLRSPPDRLV